MSSFLCVLVEPNAVVKSVHSQSGVFKFVVLSANAPYISVLPAPQEQGRA